MIIFENKKFLADIKKNGIGATDPDAKFKLRFVMEDLVFNSSYRKNKIIEKIKAIARPYFYGLPDNLVERELEVLYNAAKVKINDPDYKKKHENKTITLYESEMQAIEALKDDKLMRLAFASLVVHKFRGQSEDYFYKFIDACEADIYRVAGFSKVSGTKKQQLWQELSDKSIVDFHFKTNRAWQFKPDWIAKRVFTVPINVELKTDKSGEKVFMKVTNYDNVLLYLRYWLKDSAVGLCVDCGCPIEKTANAKCLCSNCAALRKKVSDKARYQRNIASA